MKREGGIGVNIPTAITRPVETFDGTFKYGLTFALLLSAMYGTQIMKNAIRYEDADDSPLADLEDSELMFKLLQQSNLLGFGNVLISAAESQKYGQSAVSTALGPVAGKIEQLMRALYNLTDRRPRSLANWLAKNTPFTGGLGTERRADVPIVGTDAFEEYLESFLDTLDMAEGGSIAEKLPNRRGSFVLPSIEDLRKREMELVEDKNITVTPVEFAPVLPNVIPEVEDNSRIAPLPLEKPPVPEDNSRIAPLPPEKSEFARKAQETNALAFNKVKGYEGFKKKRYLDSKNKPTIGIGHLIKSDTIKKLMSIGYSKEDAKKIKLGKKEMTEEKVNELFQKDLPTYITSTQKLINNYESLSPSLRSELIQLNYRGDLRQGKKTRKLINAGKFKEAAKEILNNKEYKDLKSKGIDNSITDRLEAARDALLAEGTK